MTIPTIFVLHLFYNLAYTPVLVAYTLEILPVAIRAKGFAVVVCHCLLSPRFPLLIVSKESDRLASTRIEPVGGSLGFQSNRLEICKSL